MNKKAAPQTKRKVAKTSVRNVPLKKKTDTAVKSVRKNQQSKVASAKKRMVVTKSAAKKVVVKKMVNGTGRKVGGARRKTKETQVWPLVGLILVVVVFLLAVGLNALRRLKEDALLPPSAQTDMALAITQNKWLWTGTVAADGTEVKPKKADAFVLSFALDGSLITKTDCNGGRGTYEVTGKKIAISPLVSTLMFCNNAQEGDFNNELQNVQTVEIADGVMKITLGGELANWTMEFKAIDESLPVSWQSNADAAKFTVEYPEVPGANPFVYADNRAMLNLFDESLAQTGIIYFGFPTCPWCKTMLPELTAAAKEAGVDKILYYNPKDLRDSGSDDYNKLLGYIGQYLEKDDEGNPRLFVPDIYFVKNGAIIGHHAGTVESQTDVETGLTEEQRTELRGVLGGLMGQVTVNGL